MTQTPRFISLVGYPAVGKSTYADQLRTEGFTVLSADAICKEIQEERGIRTMSKCYELYRPEIDELLHKKLHTALGNRENIVFDVLNISSARRNRNLEHVKRAGGYRLEAVVIFPPEEEEHAERLARRVLFEKRATEASGLFQARIEAEYQPPTYDEGYDEISYIGVPPKQPLMRM